MLFPILLTILAFGVQQYEGALFSDDEIRVVCVLQDGYGGLPEGIFDDVFEAYGYRVPEVESFPEVNAVMMSSLPRMTENSENKKNILNRLHRASSHLKDCTLDILMTERYVYFSDTESVEPRRLSGMAPVWSRLTNFNDFVKTSAEKAENSLRLYEQWKTEMNTPVEAISPRPDVTSELLGMSENTQIDNVDVVNVMVAKGFSTARAVVEMTEDVAPTDAQSGQSRRLESTSADEYLRLFAGCDCEAYADADICRMQEHGINIKCIQTGAWDDELDGVWLSKVVQSVEMAVAMEADTVVILTWFPKMDRLSTRRGPRVLREILQAAMDKGVLPILPAGDDGVLLIGEDSREKDRPCDGVSGLCVSSINYTTGRRSASANAPPVHSLYAEGESAHVGDGIISGTAVAAVEALALVNSVQAITKSAKLMEGRRLNSLAVDTRLPVNEQLGVVTNPLKRVADDGANVILASQLVPGSAIDREYAISNAQSVAGMAVDSSQGLCVQNGKGLVGVGIESDPPFISSSAAECKQACVELWECVAFHFESGVCTLLSRVDSQYSQPNAISGPKYCPTSKEAEEIRTRTAENAVRSIVYPGAAVPLASNVYESQNAGIATAATTLADATAQFFELVPMDQAFKLGYDAYSSGFFRSRGIHFMGGSIGEPTDWSAPFPGSGVPTVECHQPGMTCCVPRKSVQKWKSSHPYLNDMKTESRCAANYRSDKDALCVTSVYEGDLDCQTTVMDMTEYTVYRNILHMPERNMNNAVCECSVRKYPDEGESSIVPNAYWEVSLQAIRKKEEAQEKQEETAERVTKALAFAQSLSSSGTQAQAATSSPSSLISQVSGNSFSFANSLVPTDNNGRRLQEGSNGECLTLWPDECIAYRSDCASGIRSEKDDDCDPVWLVEYGCPKMEFDIRVEDVECGKSSVSFSSLTFADRSPYRVKCRIKLIPMEIATVEEQCAIGPPTNTTSAITPRWKSRALSVEQEAGEDGYYLISLGPNGHALVKTTQNEDGSTSSTEVVTYDEKEISAVLSNKELGTVHTLQPDDLSFYAETELLSDGEARVVMDKFRSEPEGNYPELKTTPKFNQRKRATEEPTVPQSTSAVRTSTTTMNPALTRPENDYRVVQEFSFGMDLSDARTRASELPSIVYGRRGATKVKASSVPTSDVDMVPGSGDILTAFSVDPITSTVDSFLSSLGTKWTAHPEGASRDTLSGLSAVPMDTASSIPVVHYTFQPTPPAQNSTAANSASVPSAIDATSPAPETPTTTRRSTSRAVTEGHLRGQQVQNSSPLVHMRSDFMRSPMATGLTYYTALGGAFPKSVVVAILLAIFYNV
eukprot:GHVO01040583.1.p1 GENE.GHVO01040583.1~~GHVO01040583.1.p1  ORF type:complete len:1332 (+),score=175.75 GHVO01040583.1:673-4668(+)